MQSLEKRLAWCSSLVLGMMVLAPIQCVSADSRIEKTLKLDPGGRFVLDSDAGSVTLTGSSERGANVVMTRTTRDVVELAMRPIIARRANAHAFVSLHYNAYGDGTNPLIQPNGIETFFYRPQAEPLARAVEAAVLAYQPLPDEGVHYRSLAIVRTTWMPSVLIEGGYIIVPEQENAMRTPEFQQRFGGSHTHRLTRRQNQSGDTHFDSAREDSSAKTDMDSERQFDFGLRRTAIISAATEMAISSGEIAPISRPIGA